MGEEDELPGLFAERVREGTLPPNFFLYNTVNIFVFPFVVVVINDYVITDRIIPVNN